MWKFYRIKFFSSQRPRRAGALALSQSEAGAQSGCAGTSLLQPSTSHSLGASRRADVSCVAELPLQPEAAHLTAY